MVHHWDTFNPADSNDPRQARSEFASIICLIKTWLLQFVSPHIIAYCLSDTYNLNVYTITSSIESARCARLPNGLPVHGCSGRAMEIGLRRDTRERVVIIAPNGRKLPQLVVYDRAKMDLTCTNWMIGPPLLPRPTSERCCCHYFGDRFGAFSEDINCINQDFALPWPLIGASHWSESTGQAPVDCNTKYSRHDRPGGCVLRATAAMSWQICQAWLRVRQGLLRSIFPPQILPAS